MKKGGRGCTFFVCTGQPPPLISCCRFFCGKYLGPDTMSSVFRHYVRTCHVRRIGGNGRQGGILYCRSLLSGVRFGVSRTSCAQCVFPLQRERRSYWDLALGGEPLFFFFAGFGFTEGGQAPPRAALPASFSSGTLASKPFAIAKRSCTYYVRSNAGHLLLCCWVCFVLPPLGGRFPWVTIKRTKIHLPFSLSLCVSGQGGELRRKNNPASARGNQSRFCGVLRWGCCIIAITPV